MMSKNYVIAKCSTCKTQHSVQVNMTNEHTEFECQCGTKNKLTVHFNVTSMTKIVTEKDLQNSINVIPPDQLKKDDE